MLAAVAIQSSIKTQRSRKEYPQMSLAITAGKSICPAMITSTDTRRRRKKNAHLAANTVLGMQKLIIMPVVIRSQSTLQPQKSQHIGRERDAHHMLQSQLMLRHPSLGRQRQKRHHRQQTKTRAGPRFPLDFPSSTGIQERNQYYCSDLFSTPTHSANGSTTGQ